MSYDYEGRSFTTNLPTLKSSDIKLDWTHTGRFFTPIQESSRTFDAITSWLPTLEENRLDIETETEMLKDTGIKSTGNRTQKEVENILRWRKKDEQRAFDISRTTAPGFAMMAQFASAIFNPVEVAVGTAAALVPGLGPAYLTAKVAAKGTKLKRVLEAGKVGAVQQTAVGIGFEPLNYAVETHYGHDYGLTDSLFNVTANTVFGGLFGGSVQRFSDRKGFARTHQQRIWDELPQTSKGEITNAIKVAMDNNVSLKTTDIINIARTDRFFRYASKEGEGDGGFYDRVRASFLKETFVGRPDLEIRYHELNLDRITKGKHSVLKLDYKPETPIEDLESLIVPIKRTKQQAIKEAKQFEKVVELNEKLYEAKQAKLELKLSDVKRITPSDPDKVTMADILKAHDEHIKVGRIFNDELAKMSAESKQVLSIIQADKPIERSHRKTLNKVMEAEHAKDSTKMLSDLRTMVNKDPLQADPKHETPETPVETYDTTPENYEQMLKDMEAQVDEPVKKADEIDKKSTVEESFKKYGEVKSDCNPNGPCITRALSIAFNKNLDSVIQKYEHSQYFNAQDYMGKPFGRFFSKELGVDFRLKDYTTRDTTKVKGYNLDNSISLDKFLKENSTGEFLIEITQHLAFVKNGKVYDVLYGTKKKPDKNGYTNRTKLVSYYKIIGNDRLKSTDLDPKKTQMDDTTTTALETSKAVTLRNKKLQTDLEVLDKANEWMENFNLGDCNG